MRINLIPVEQRPLRSNSVRWPVIIVFIGIVCLLVLSGYSLMQSATVREKREELSQLQQSRVTLERQRQQIDSLQTMLQNIQRTENIYTDLVRSADNRFVIGLLDVFATSGIPEIWLESVVFQESSFRATGYTFDPTSLARLLHVLSVNEYIVAVEQLNHDLTNRLVTFSLSITGGQ